MVQLGPRQAKAAQRRRSLDELSGRSLVALLANRDFCLTPKSDVQQASWQAAKCLQQEVRYPI